MQNTLTRVEVRGPLLRHAFGTEPVSLMRVANGFRKAPALCWRQDSKLSPRATQWASSPHASGGFAKAELMTSSKQKPQKTRGCAPLTNEALVCVPVESANGI